jgi:hypothetical protein
MPGLAERALRIIRERYADFGPTLPVKSSPRFMGCIWSRDGTQADDTGWFMAPRKSRPPRVHQPRPRRACTGTHPD